MTLFIRNSEAYSPLRSPFGSLEFDENTNIQDINYFFKELDKWLVSRKIEKVFIVSYPYCYNQKHSEMVTHCFLKNGYFISEYDMNFHLQISSDNFEKKLDPAARRRYAKFKDKFQFSIEESPDIETIFSLIKENREIKGNPVSITPEVLGNLYYSFKENFKSFLLKDGETLIGSAFGVRVSENVLYYYLAADSYGYKKYSPSTIMIGQIYNYCLQAGISIFDLGIATSKSVPNFGLIKFKQNMGGIVSLKLSFEKILN
ncbi:GNAT family N-acetyltransferase [Sporocytophaga myxococcoides]|nr:GNAT family N-acetyltransferase [Sporocytophaga myxococcoides]